MKCPICGYLSKASFDKSYLPKIFHCPNCSICFISHNKLARYNKSYYRDSNPGSLVSSFLQPILDMLTGIKIRRVLLLVKSVKHPRILDYGCGAGEMVKQLKFRKVNILGFEPSGGALQMAVENRLPISSNLNKIKGKFNLIMLWHSLEHIDNPVTALTKIRKMLKPHGRVLIAIPNVDSYEAKIAKGRWFHFTYPEHRFYYSPKTLSYLLKKCSLKIENIDYLNFEYTFTGLAQTALNLIFPKDVLYSVVSMRRRTLRKSKAVLVSLLSICVLIFLSPVLIIVFIMELFFRKTGAIVVTAK